MKRKILFNVCIFASIIILIFFLIFFIIQFSNSIQNYFYTKEIINDGFDVSHLLPEYKKEIIKNLVFILLILYVSIFNLFVFIKLEMSN